MFNKQKFIYNRILNILPDLIICIILIIYFFYHHVIYGCSVIMYNALKILLFFCIINSLYLKLYSWRNLTKSFFSFFIFLLITTQLFLYLYTGFLLIYTIEDPIYLNDISVFSQYRYLILFSISCCALIVVIISVIFKLNFYQNPIITFPFIKEEFRLILDTWQSTAFGEFFIFISNKLLRFKSYRFIYIFVDILYYLFRIILLFLFISFCFFNKDLRSLFYFIPGTFLFWILSFFTYYIEYIIQGNTNYIRELIEISSVESSEFPKTKQAFILKLSPQAYKQGLTEQHIPLLMAKWLELGNFTVFLQYKHFFKYISISIFLSYFFCWCFLTYYFFFSAETVINNSPWVIFRQSFIWKPPIMRSPRDARLLREIYQNPLKQTSNNEFAIGHPIFGEMQPDGNYRVDGFLTKSTSHGIPIMNTPIMPNKTGAIQNAVFFSAPIYIPGHWIALTIQGSLLKLEEPGVKALLDYIANYKTKS